MPQAQPHHAFPARPSRLVILVTMLAVVGAGGCKAWRVSEVTPEELIRAEQPSQVRLVTTSDSNMVVLFQPTIVGDSLRGLPTELAVRPRMIALSHITEISTKHFNLGKSLLFAGFVAAIVVAYDLLQSLNETSF